MKNFNISVIMTVKNGSEFVWRSLNSVKEQSFQPSEIVIVDDGSTDDTCLKVEEFIKTTNLVIKLIKTKGVGRSKALNLAVFHSAGDWIANLDVDDYWFPIKLEQQIKCLSQSIEGSLVATETTIHIENKPQEPLYRNENILDLIKFRKLKGKDFYIGNPINHSSVLFNKEVFNDIGCYNDELTKQIDIDLWRRFLGRSESIHIVKAPLTVKYLHSKQSFEANKVISYRINGLKSKFKTLKLLSAPYRYYVLALAFFIAQFFPRRFKEFIKKLKLAYSNA